ncbi:DUF6923 family protein [Dyadobacter tibetensis]|uniref:DUF6923 family protein n=1 Tax=Dyadobacter tibetensis TaxID=1211851 RepID=UPI000471C3E1|nr:GEVED domain-containing protein [Dyadobacter tibetensis]
MDINTIHTNILFLRKRFLFNKFILLLFISFYAADSNAANVTVTLWADGDGNARKATQENVIDGSTTTVWVNLLDFATNQVISQKAVGNTGVATITGAINNAAYRLVLTSSQPALGDVLLESSLPTNWVNTGVNLTANATGTGDASNRSGKLDINMPASGNLSNIFFGIEQRPTALSVTASAQQNPGGNYQMGVVSPNALDAEDGNIWSTGTGTVKIETLPTNGVLYYNGSLVTLGQVIGNFNQNLLKLDPNDGVSSVAFNYSVIDRAGASSSDIGTITMPLTEPIEFTCDSYVYQVLAATAANNSTLYRYNPFSGSRVAIKTLSSRYNAIGYNVKDNLIWGTDDHQNRLVRIDAQGNETFYTVPNLPTSTYNNADVTTDGYYYIFQSSESKFYVIDLNETSPNFLKLVDPTIGYALDTSPYGTTFNNHGSSDIAYNPTDNYFYTIRTGTGTNPYKMIKYSPVDMSSTVATNSVRGGGIQGEGWGAGATFFDKDGNFFIFNNQQGKYYRIDLVTNEATLLSTGISSSYNDGASCPTAESFRIDLGDAPDTYQTLYNSGGPSHTINANLLLGQNIDPEDEGKPSVDADGDDNTDVPDDEDGLPVIPALGTAYTSYNLKVDVTNNTGAAATLSGWIDFNRNGVFNSSERAQVNVPAGATSVTLNWTGLSGLSAGQSYIRLRLASIASEVANPGGDSGSANNGEVEDYPITIYQTPPPTAVPDEFSTSCEMGSVNILENDIAGGAPIVPAQTRLIDPADGSRVLTVSIAGEGVYTLDPGTGIVQFTPASNFQGISTVDYVIVDENALESTSTISVNVNCPLPVTLISFSATTESETTILSWSTVMESNSSHFVIERSNDAKTWNAIGQVETHGESEQLRKYDFIDQHPLKGENLYRLKMVDLDLSFSYSRLVSVKFKQVESGLSVYPNPATEYLMVDQYQEGSLYQLIRQNGDPVNAGWSKIEATGKIRLDGLTSGIYLLNIMNVDGALESHKVIVIK